MGGPLSLGYDVKDRKLIVNKIEAEMVRHIFRRYTELKSVRELKEDLDAAGIVSKVRTASDGSRHGGQPIARGALYLMLQNRIYRGEIVHKGKSYPGEHESHRRPSTVEQCAGSPRPKPRRSSQRNDRQ